MAIGVFGLQVAYKLKRLEVMSTDDTHGWFGGGATPTSISTVDRIDFSNDSSNLLPRSPLSLARNSLAATGNSNYGWFGGGYFPTPATYSTVDRIDFSNDLAQASPRSPLSSARGYLAATGNSNYGWFGNSSRVDRIDFSNDSSTASVRGSLLSSKQKSAATGNSNYGWWGGGFPAVATVNRIDFSNDSSTASPRGALSAARYFLAATSGVLNIRRQKAGNYGWFGGGFAPSPLGGTRSTVDRIDFSNDSVSASPRGTLTLISSGDGKSALAATGNSNYGWFGGGYTPTTPSPASTRVSTVDRIDFSNDSPIASIRGPLTSIRQGLAATGNSNYGWFGGGEYSGVATVDRIDFSNDSVSASPRSQLSLARGFLAATGNSNYGWFGGGYIQPAIVPANFYSRVDRINFSNDSSTASIRGPLSSPAGRSQLAATGNSNYGWFGGGSNPGAVLATVDRIDFSNDSPSVLVRGPLFTARYNLAATGNSNYGWFGAGTNPSFIPTSIVDRIDFSNDSVQTSPRGLLTAQKSLLAATSNTNK